KFTERGEIRISARPTPDGTAVVFSVADTGIGIAAEDQERIFEDFTQVENPVQKRVRGTGLGLPLVRRYAELLGGHVSVAATLAVGSTFTAVTPTRYAATAQDELEMPSPEEPIDRGRPTVLLVEDSPQDLLLYEHYFRNSSFQLASARTLREARRLLER